MRDVDDVVGLEHHVPAASGENAVDVDLEHLRIREPVADDDHVAPVGFLHPAGVRQLLDEAHALLVEAAVGLADLAADGDARLHGLGDEDVVALAELEVVERIAGDSEAHVDRQDLPVAHDERVLKVGDVDVGAVEKANGAAAGQGVGVGDAGRVRDDVRTRLGAGAGNRNRLAGHLRDGNAHHRVLDIGREPLLDRLAGLGDGAPADLDLAEEHHPDAAVGAHLGLDPDVVVPVDPDLDQIAGVDAVHRVALGRNRPQLALALGLRALVASVGLQHGGAVGDLLGVGQVLEFGGDAFGIAPRRACGKRRQRRRGGRTELFEQDHLRDSISLSTTFSETPVTSAIIGFPASVAQRLA